MVKQITAKKFKFSQFRIKCDNEIISILKYIFLIIIIWFKKFKKSNAVGIKACNYFNIYILKN